MAKKDATDSKPDDILAEAIEAFDLCAEREDHNRVAALDDIRFALLSEQWNPKEVADRERDGRPCLTSNKLGPIIRQVVNDARQNSPSIVVHPVDSQADPETAEIINGLIRNIEAVSDADVAYDTALESAVTGGFGYFRINIAYADDDTFDKDICIRRIANPFSVYGDPYSSSASSDDWNTAFVIDKMAKSVFEKKYKGADAVDWKSDGYAGLRAPWMDGDEVQVAEYWTRDEYPCQIVMLSSGEVVKLDLYESNKDHFDAEEVTIVGSPRTIKSHKVKQRIMTGAEVLETVEWVGKYIPLIPVYGQDVNVEGKRYLRSMIRDAKDPQRMHNYWRTISTELVALAPKAPYIGALGQFKTDSAKWASANTHNHAYIEYNPVKDAPPPQRQPFAGVPAGALQEAINASDDIKAITGIFDASLGAKSNETSGRAILMRQREGDVGSFHFIDNLSRSIRHAGRVIIDLIPHVYTTERMIRVLGQDGSPQTVPVNQPVMVLPQQPGQPPKPPQAITPEIEQQAKIDPAAAEQLKAMTKVFDLTVGKYDVAVEAGPSYTTQREVAAQQMMDLIQADPAVAPLIGDLLVKNLDWPGADEIAKRLQQRVPGAPGSQGPNPEMVKMQGEQQLAQQKQQADQQQAQAETAARMQIAKYEADTKAAVTTQQNQLEHERAVSQQQGQMQLELVKIKSAETIARINAEAKIAAASAGAKMNDGSQNLSYQETHETA